MIGQGVLVQETFVITAMHAIDQNQVTSHKIGPEAAHKTAPEAVHFQVLVRDVHQVIIIGVVVPEVVLVAVAGVHVAAVVEDDKGFKNDN